MRVAVAKEGTQVSGHFGHCEGFQVYEVDNNKVLGSTFIPNPGHRPGYLPVFLAEQKVNVIVSGGMGATAQELFSQNNIEVVVGATGASDQAVQRFVSGELKSTGSVCDEHAHHDSCGE